jgi:hypothetical protein
MWCTDRDPRADWAALQGPTLAPAAAAALAALPTGAREAPLGWVGHVEEVRETTWDRDAQEARVHERRRFVGWRDAPDRRLPRAAALSFHGVDVEPAALRAWPDWLWPAIRVLRFAGPEVAAPVLDAPGRSGVEDLLLVGPPRRDQAPAVISALAQGWDALRGLSLPGARLDVAACAALAGAAWWPRLEDLHLAGGGLDPRGFAPLVDGLGALSDLDLRDQRLQGVDWGRLAPRLRRARGVQLAGNPLGDAGALALLEGGAFDRVEALGLDGTGVGDRFAAALAARAPASLRALWLSGDAIGPAGVAALLDGPLLDRLDALALGGNPGSAAAAARLAGHPLAAAAQGTARRRGAGCWWLPGR